MSESDDIWQRFRGLEEMAAEIRHWDLEFRPLAADRGGTELLQVRLGPLLLTHLDTGCGHRHRGAAPPGGATFALLADGAQTVHWCRQRLDPEGLPFFEAGQEFEASAHPRFSVFTLTVDAERLASDPLWERVLRHLRRPGTGRSGIYRASPYARHRLRQRIAATLSVLAKDGPDVADQGAAQVMGDLVVGDLRQALEEADPAADRSTAWARARAVQRALEYLHSHPQEPVNVVQLGAIAKVSERTLQRAFLEHYGIGPKAYACRLKLTEMRADLLRCEAGEVFIKDLAIAHGFWHMGQFSRDYRDLFGELPSETLERAPPPRSKRR
jgi:AraC family ethanolamine operon transcriptional activator